MCVDQATSHQRHVEGEQLATQFTVDASVGIRVLYLTVALGSVCTFTAHRALDLSAFKSSCHNCETAQCCLIYGTG